MTDPSQRGGPLLVEERRASPRVSMRLRVRRADSPDPFIAREGNLSLGGFAWFGGALPVGTRVEARFVLPGAPEELGAWGVVLHVGHGGRGSSAHVRFQDLPADVESRIARYLDELELSEPHEGGGGDA